MLTALTLLAALSTGTVRLQLVDEYGRGIPNHPVWLDPTNSTKPLRSFGHLWMIPQTKLRGRTDAAGKVAISRVARGKPMMVVTTFGPRFDPFLKKQEFVRDGSVDVMKLDGAVVAGKPARVVLAKNYAIVGTVVDSSGKPVPGVPVSLQDTMYGHMSGYPLTELDETTTNATGSFRFSQLPNCSFTLTPQPQAPYATESFEAKQRWDLVGIDSGKGYSGAGGVIRRLDRPVTRCDFRISRPAEVTVLLRRESRVSLKDWMVNIGDSGWQPGFNGFDTPDGATNTWAVLAGKHRLVFERETDHATVVVQTVEVREGDKKTIEVRMSDVLRRVPRRK